MIPHGRDAVRYRSTRRFRPRRESENVFQSSANVQLSTGIDSDTGGGSSVDTQIASARGTGRGTDWKGIGIVSGAHSGAGVGRSRRRIAVTSAIRKAKGESTSPYTSRHPGSKKCNANS